jgi:hypothetical protein
MTAAVTQRDTALCSAESVDAPAERVTSPATSQTGSFPVQSAITQRDRLQDLLRAARGYVTPPAVLTDRPASVAELSAYAHRAGWTARSDGPLRVAGVWWFRLIGLPLTVAGRYVEWIAQRPGRAIPVFGLWKLVILTGGGPWFADHVIRPVGHVLAWVLL